MPYVPTGDRPAIDEVVNSEAAKLVEKLEAANIDKVYFEFFLDFDKTLSGNGTNALALKTLEVAEKYKYDGAHLGEDNYAITRLIQVVPQLAVKAGKWKEELRYWVYAKTVSALVDASKSAITSGMSGVFEDIKDEYKRRVNPSYEAAQIIKSGDCYDTPYYNRLIPITRKNGTIVGHVLVDMPRSAETLDIDVLNLRLIAD